MERRPHPLLSLVAVSATLVLSACATAPTAATVSFDAVVVPGDGETASIFGVSFWMFDADVAFAPSRLPAALAPADVVEIEPGIHVFDVTLAASGDTVALALPTEDEIPAGTMVPAADAFYNAVDGSDCTIVADPASAHASSVLFEFVSLPGFVAVAAEGLGYVLATDDPIVGDPSPPTDGDAYYGWIFADAPVTISFGGSDCSGLVAPGLDLASGWNTLLFTYDSADGVFVVTQTTTPATLQFTAFGFGSGL